MKTGVAQYEVVVEIILNKYAYYYNKLTCACISKIVAKIKQYNEYVGILDWYSFFLERLLSDQGHPVSMKIFYKSDNIRL